MDGEAGVGECIITDLMQCSKEDRYSISAVVSTYGEIVSPRGCLGALEVVHSNLVGCWAY